MLTLLRVLVPKYANNWVHASLCTDELWSVYRSLGTAGVFPLHLWSRLILNVSDPRSESDVTTQEDHSHPLGVYRGCPMVSKGGAGQRWLLQQLALMANCQFSVEPIKPALMQLYSILVRLSLWVLYEMVSLWTHFPFKRCWMFAISAPFYSSHFPALPHVLYSTCAFNHTHCLTMTLRKTVD